MALTPVDELVSSGAPLVEVADRAVDLTAVERVGESIAIAVVGDGYILLVFWEQGFVISTGAVEDLTVVVHVFIRHVLPEGVILRRQSDVLGSIPADAINAAVL